MPKIIKLGENLTTLWKKNNCDCFLRHSVFMQGR